MAGEVVLLEQADRKTAARRVARDTGTVNAAADDRKVVDLAVRCEVVQGAAAPGAAAQRQASSPLSKTIRQRPLSSRRQMDVYVLATWPLGSVTGPVEIASVPLASTRNVSGFHANGAAASV